MEGQIINVHLHSLVMKHIVLFNHIVVSNESVCKASFETSEMEQINLGCLVPHPIKNYDTRTAMCLKGLFIVTGRPLLQTFKAGTHTPWEVHVLHS